MSIEVIVAVVWGVFWVGWFLAAITATPGARPRRARVPGLLFVIAFVVLRSSGATGGAIHSPPVRALGLLLLAAGLGVAIWARVYLGRNWGMPMTEKERPELVTSGPYRFVRHPIYSGLLLAMLGSALAATLWWLVILAGLGSYFIYSARVEERLMTTAFPDAYPAYRATSKMLIPFVF
ncbi:MAG TPA: isoprenylcysteine carboxylmethyltransferase family protein [Solirubrobacteraceae bacterium]|nr:isoprenylcysteine carboxylmethyltransferase family protein [Solirubrobacteraceae bacterium]